LAKKDQTGGRSTDLLGERDLHVYCLPELPSEMDYNAIISVDVVDEILGTNIRIAKLDSLFGIHAKPNVASVSAAPSSARVLTRQR